VETKQRDCACFRKEDILWKELQVYGPLEKEFAVQFKRFAKIGYWVANQKWSSNDKLSNATDRKSRYCQFWTCANQKKEETWSKKQDIHFERNCQRKYEASKVPSVVHKAPE